MNVILFDAPGIRLALLPLTYTRPVAKIRIGILTIAEKWEKRLGTPISFDTEEYLSVRYAKTASSENIFVNGGVCPTKEICQEIVKLDLGEALFHKGHLIAVKTSEKNLPSQGYRQKEFGGSLTIINAPWKIFRKNSEQIKADFDIITAGRTSNKVEDPHTIVYAPENLFIEEGATIKASIINAESGPVYIGKNAVINEGAIIRGSFALCEGASLNMGAKIRGDSTVGPYCKVGGEVGNSVLFGYSNKGHDGYLGNSVLGEWCNLGADTNTSNLKNNYGSIKIWNYEKEKFEDTDQTFCGLIMGDHSKCGINTMFNTGTVVGVSSNIFGSGFPSKFIPSFSWGGSGEFTTYDLQKANDVATNIMKRREVSFDETDTIILKAIFDKTVQYRTWKDK